MTARLSILVIEDDKSICSFITTTLSGNGYRVRAAFTGREGLSLAASLCPDVILLDLGLPDVDGCEVLQKIRLWSHVPIIIVSACNEEQEKVKALDSGADDYVTKPFSPMELVARVDAVFRRVNMAAVIPEPENELKSGPFLLNVRSRSLTKDGKKIDLTQVEFQLMEHFLRNPNVALDRSSLLATVWGDSYFGDDKIVDVNMRRLRMKVEDEPSKPKYLTTVWGFGYKWVCPDRPAKEAER